MNDLAEAAYEAYVKNTGEEMTPFKDIPLKFQEAWRNSALVVSTITIAEVTKELEKLK